MRDLAYVTDANIKRFRKLLETSINEPLRRTIQTLLIEELVKAEAPTHQSTRAPTVPGGAT